MIDAIGTVVSALARCTLALVDAANTLDRAALALRGYGLDARDVERAASRARRAASRVTP